MWHNDYYSFTLQKILKLPKSFHLVNRNTKSGADLILFLIEANLNSPTSISNLNITDLISQLAKMNITLIFCALLLIQTPTKLRF